MNNSAQNYTIQPIGNLPVVQRKNLMETKKNYIYFSILNEDADKIVYFYLFNIYIVNLFLKKIIYKV